MFEKSYGDEQQILPIELLDVDGQTGIRKKLLSLNNEHAEELSWLDEDRLAYLIRSTFVAWRIGAIDAFLLAFDQDADYDGENFHWFKSRYDRFIYVDRVVVAAEARGRGLARHFYGQLFAAAIDRGQTSIVCEVNAHPPNPKSDAFHASFGFEPVGGASLRAGMKTVRYLHLNLINRIRD